MRKVLIIGYLCLMALSLNAQRCAVLEFKAGTGISQSDVDGIVEIFITYFQPSGYTMVERTQIDKVIDEQGFQRSNLTERQMVRIGQILNVSKIVVGTVNVVMGQYNVDTRVINVESGTIAASEGAQFTGSYRSSMQSVAQKLAAKIAITPARTVISTQSQTQIQQPKPTAPKKRSSVEVLYGYLKVFPNELGEFQSEPTTVINQINNQAQHGYNNWRIPTNEELALLKANGYLGGGKYMTRESRNGIVLLVSDGESYSQIQAKEQERIAAEKKRLQEEEQQRIAAEEQRRQLEEQRRIEAERLRIAQEEQRRKEAEEQRRQLEEQRRIEAERLRIAQEEQRRIEAEKLRIAQEEQRRKEAEEQRRKDLFSQGYLDLGLPSGTLWKSSNEDNNHFYSFEQAKEIYDGSLPTEEQWSELLRSCEWQCLGNYISGKGPNGSIIRFRCCGYNFLEKDPRPYSEERMGVYWTSNGRAVFIYNYGNKCESKLSDGIANQGYNIRLVD